MGHLFVVHGDMTKLACDGLLIPCDSQGDVSKDWRQILPPGLLSSPRNSQWLTLQSEQEGEGVFPLPDSDKRKLWAFVTVTVNGVATPERVVERTWKAIEFASARLEKHDGRVRPLIAIPLPGTGQGGLAGKRAEVIGRLLARYRSELPELDVVIVLRDRRDFAAVQEQREDSDWAELPVDLCDHADRLGRLAADGELSLFVGAGLSVPVGLPNWWELLDLLADDAELDPPSRDQDEYRAATPIVKALGANFHKKLRGHLATKQHGVGHALLASIRVKRIVTTNFDSCMELALKVPADNSLRVLVRQLAIGGSPWLLKLNGDIRQRGSIILTTADLKKNPKERRALEGVVQSLLLTSHLLFVGFSLTDRSFLKLAKAVSNVRARATDSVPPKPGTAIALTDDGRKRARYTDLHMLSMNPKSIKEGAHTLEIFLDRLVCAATRQSNRGCEYLLDERYLSGLSPKDTALRDLLVDMRQKASADAVSSSAWARVSACLHDLGADTG